MFLVHVMLTTTPAILKRFPKSVFFPEFSTKHSKTHQEQFKSFFLISKDKNWSCTKYLDK